MQNAKHQPARADGAALWGTPGVFAYADLDDLIPLKNGTFPGASEVIGWGRGAATEETQLSAAKARYKINNATTANLRESLVICWWEQLALEEQFMPQLCQCLPHKSMMKL